MSNRERFNFEGAIHHVWQRGNNKEYIFKEAKSKAFFIKQLKEYNKKLDYNILAYVVMDNHYHLLIQTFKNPIREVMFNINNTTGKYIKENSNRSGHIFQGRYNSKLVQSKEYFLWLIRYIHRNPVRAKICTNVEEYKWSSHSYYIKGYSNFVNVSFPLSVFDYDNIKATDLYLRLMQLKGKEDTEETDFHYFKKQLSNLNGEKLYPNVKFEHLPQPSIQKIAESLKLSSEDIHLLTSGSRKRNLTNLKIKLINKALKEKHSISQIALYLNVTQSAISKLILNNNNS